MSRPLFIGILFVVCILVAAAGCTSQPAANTVVTPTVTAVPTTSAPATIETTFLSLPQASLNETERADIIQLQEDQKFITDLNAVLATQHPDIPVFQNIANGSKFYQTADNVILQRYGIPNPEKNVPGVFASQKLKLAYNNGVNTGSMSAKDALLVSATAEDIHIADLEAALTRTDNTDLQFIYKQELGFSRNNLRTLSQWIKSYGGLFTPTYITVDYYNALTNSPTEQVLIQ
ncbi:DUF2202 domain-containing protein [uncultured Methanoregula sp.]|uniref:DUF2202 domain-containing protein n=1 Tax=uncultured Methanoregula sp. TaxID=1005933 RepID=UPI002AABFFCA|nr:DUF2202 domain-containing protein [uncultured Methanoregula sp.]